MAFAPQLLLEAQSDGRLRSRLRHAASEHFLNRQPALWREEEITGKLAASVGSVDKAFAAAWQDSQHLLVGTKCNKLLQWDTATNTLRSIPLPPVPPRWHSVLQTVWGSCGIHCVAVNPAGDMVATGGSEPADGAVLSLPDFQPIQTLVGHQDWVFGCAWVSDRHLVTASRDQSVALWSIPEAGSSAPPAQYQFPAGQPGSAGLLRRFEGKVRDVKYDFDTCRLAALSTEGCVKLLDTARGLRTVRSVKLDQANELVCLDQRADLMAVGSVGHVTLLDPRRRNAQLQSVASPDENQGVRSVALTEHLLSFGTGRGKLFFYDVRAQGFLSTAPAAYDYGAESHMCKLSPSLLPRGQPRHLKLGEGYVEHNDLYYDHFDGMDVKHACYAHCWDASRTRLFVCGGPLAFGLHGCYMAVWH